jgi:hypothetical protein
LDTAEASTELSFDKATYTGGDAAVPCAHCSGALGEQYWQWQTRPVCATCRTRIEQTLVASQSRPAFLRAVLLGGLTALGCGIAYAVFVALTDYQLALVTIGIAYLVAKVLRRCSSGIGGRKYQILAIVLTYIASAMGYAPGVIKGAMDGAHESHASEAGKSASQAAPVSGAAAHAERESAGTQAQQAHSVGSAFGALLTGLAMLFAGVALLFLVTLAAPILAATQAPLGLLIVAFGLFEAWKLTRGVPLAVEGPFRAAPAASPAPAA